MKNTENQRRLINPVKPIKSETLSLRENNVLTRTISIVFLILIMFGLFAFIIYGLYKFNLIEIPEFIGNIFSKNNDSFAETKNSEEDIYNFLPSNTESGSENSGGYTLDITPENIKDVISKISLPDSMHLETTAKYYTDGKLSKTIEMSLWEKNGKYKYTLTVNSELEEVYINDTKKEYTENYKTGSKTTKNADALFNFNNIPNIPNLNYYLNLLDSGQSRIANCNIERGGENTASIKYEIPILNQWETIYFSLDTGIVSRVECCAGNGRSLYYECETSADENTEILDSMFVIK